MASTETVQSATERDDASPVTIRDDEKKKRNRFGDATDTTHSVQPTLDSDDIHTSTSLMDAPRAKRRRHVDYDQLAAVRKQLFLDGVEQPSQNVFYMEGERIDMENPDTCSIQRRFFARIFNTMLLFSKCKFTEKSVVHRNLAWEAELTANRLKRLMNSGYARYHLEISSYVLYILRALEDIHHVRANEMIFQMVPITCNIDRSIRSGLKVNGLEVFQINNSASLSVNLNVDLKFLYAGQFRVRSVPGQGEKYYVALTPCMGDYLHTTVIELYDLIYDLTREYIREFFERHPKDPVSKSNTDTDIREIGAYTVKDRVSSQHDASEKKTLAYLLNSVGRDLNLKKIDLEKNTVFVLTSALKSTVKYLCPKSDLTCTIEKTPTPDAEAVFLSSYTRARVMEDGFLNFQVYSRACIYLSDNEEFPKEDTRSMTAHPHVTIPSPPNCHATNEVTSVN